ncbi:MAG: zinc ribbon domain-containing protein [Planctomycetota bacterium]
MNDDAYDDFDEDSELEELIVCPECRAELHADAEACPECGYWITEADRSAAWNAGSTTGVIKTIGFVLVAVAALAWLVLSLG